MPSLCPLLCEHTVNAKSNESETDYWGGGGIPKMMHASWVKNGNKDAGSKLSLKMEVRRIGTAKPHMRSPQAERKLLVYSK